MESTVSTSDPAGFVPASVEGGRDCASSSSGIVPILRRPAGSRSDYQSGVAREGALPGVDPRRDYVTGVALPASNAVLRVGW